jgi:hypothetical protein
MTSKIDFTKGPTRAASTGRTSLQFNEFNVLMVVDDQGVAVPVDSTGVTSHPMLSNRDDDNAHPISAITNLSGTLNQLQTDLTGAENNITSMQLTLVDHQTQIDDNLIITNTKEDSLGNPIISGSCFASDINGTRYWIEKEDDLGFPAGNGYILVSDITGVRSWIPHTESLSVHNNLSGRDSVDSHPQMAITGLINDLTLKEDGLGNPVTDGMHLASLANGTRFWSDQKPKFFSAKNEIVESHQAVATQAIDFDVEIYKDPIFTHSTNNEAEDIIIDFSGFIVVWYTLSFENNESNRIMLQSQVTINDAVIPQGTAYGYSRSSSYVDALTVTCCCMMPVSSGDNLNILTRLTDDGTINTLGDTENVQTLFGQSSITIMTVPLGA